MPRLIEITGRLTKIKEVNPSGRVIMKIREETYQIMKEHAIKYYSNPTFDEIIINSIKFYEQNDGPKHYND